MSFLNCPMSKKHNLTWSLSTTWSPPTSRIPRLYPKSPYDKEKKPILYLKFPMSSKSKLPLKSPNQLNQYSSTRVNEINKFYLSQKNVQITISQGSPGISFNYSWSLRHTARILQEITFFPCDSVRISSIPYTNLKRLVVKQYKEKMEHNELMRAF